MILKLLENVKSAQKSSAFFIVNLSVLEIILGRQKRQNAIVTKVIWEGEGFEIIGEYVLNVLCNWRRPLSDLYCFLRLGTVLKPPTPNNLMTEIFNESRGGMKKFCGLEHVWIFEYRKSSGG